MTEAQTCCDSRKRRWRYYAPMGKKELAAAAKQRRQRYGARARASPSPSPVAEMGVLYLWEGSLFVRLALPLSSLGHDRVVRWTCRCSGMGRGRGVPYGINGAWSWAVSYRSSGSREEWQAAAHDGWQRRQVRSREEGEKQGRRGDRVSVCDRGLQAAVRRRLR
ncbi:hypothetical protein GW17_00047991 [Ensete ventricosum]|nr:hypothetical protein GW17_00047991 [Ensete ventricosum]RZS15419.1 hypothetical protein BHM03_00047256 [Ensete ventricosum]